jgi:hypothetical protein
MSKLTIADLTNEVELSSATLRAISGGMSCEAATAANSCYQLTSRILGILGDATNSSGYENYGNGLQAGACGK